MTTRRSTVLVLAGTGKTGRRIAARLAARRVPVRIGSRHAEPPFDWQDESTWERVLRGVDSAYVAYHPDAAFPGAARAVGRFASCAMSCGVRHLVLLADRGSAEAERCEQAVISSGVEWTIVRTGFITQNFSEAFLADMVRAGVVALPVGDVSEPFTDAEDIADIVVAVLTEPGHSGVIHEITGPRSITFAEAVGAIADEIHREVRFLSIPPEQFISSLTARGLPATYARQLTELMAEVFDGRRESVTDTIERVLARSPRDFIDYVRETATTGVWGGAGEFSGG